MKDAYDNIIAYEEIKNELKRICDILRYPSKYKKLGVHMPDGLLLHKDPGTGKTIMAKCFITASERKCFISRKTKTNEDFLDKIVKTFTAAKENAPSIVFLDDINKFKRMRDGIPGRIAFRLPSEEDSLLILGVNGAEKLEKPGEMMFIMLDSKVYSEPKHLQAIMDSQGRIEEVCDRFRA